MHLYHARVEVAHHDPISVEREAQLSLALTHFQPAVGESARGRLEVRLSLVAENLMQATITAVSAVWTAVGAEPVAVDMALAQT